MVEWEKLTNRTSRRQTVELQNEPFNGKRLKLVRQKVAVATGPACWLMLGAATSPLEYQLRCNGHVKCFNQGCSQFGPSWNHCMRECPCRHASRQEMPISGLLRRFGWPVVETDDALVQSMVETVEG